MALIAYAIIREIDTSPIAAGIEFILKIGVYYLHDVFGKCLLERDGFGATTPTVTLVPCIEYSFKHSIKKPCGCSACFS